MLTDTRRESINERSIRELWWLWLIVGVIISFCVCMVAYVALMIASSDTATITAEDKASAQNVPPSSSSSASSTSNADNNDTMVSACMMGIDQDVNKKLMQRVRIEFVDPLRPTYLGGHNIEVFQAHGLFSYENNGFQQMGQYNCYVTSDKNGGIEASVATSLKEL